MYAKIFTSMYQGTLRGNSHGLLVFTNLLAHSDKNGEVDIHPRAISEEVGLTIEQVKAALIELESPDIESRSPEEEGRRIIRLDEHRMWGWLIVNHGKYKAIRDEEDRREQNRKSQEAYRNRSKQTSAKSNQHSAESAHTDTDTNTYPALAPVAPRLKKRKHALEVPPSAEMDEIVSQCEADGFPGFKG